MSQIATMTNMGSALRASASVDSTKSAGSASKSAGKAAKQSATAEKASATSSHEIPVLPALTTYMSYAILILFGHIRDWFGKLTGWSRYFGGNNAPKPGYAPLLKDWENFYTRRLYHPIQDCWNRPIGGPPTAGAIRVLERESKDGNYSLDLSGKERTCINLGSYNYLGFADDWEETCAESVKGSLQNFPASTCSAATDGGYTSLHRDLEKEVATFVGKEDAVIFNMGYGTNTGTLPSLVGKGCLILSDNLNHTSIVNGARASGAEIRPFAHDNHRKLDAMLKDAIITGQPRTRRPWRKIIVLIEGVYSMEGEICSLKEMVRVCKKYKAYIYLDEAHSIGALGPGGRGVCAQKGVPPSDIDVMMGTFTKSFGAMGGYIAGSKEFVRYLRSNSTGQLYGNCMSPVVCQQVLTALRVIRGTVAPGVGERKLRTLKEQSNYFREKCVKMGLQVYGDYDSPVVPVMLYHPAKIAAFSRECFKRGVAVVVVGYPATPLVTSRVRFCISAGHSREQLDKALEVIEEVSTILGIRYCSNPVLG